MHSSADKIDLLMFSSVVVSFCEAKPAFVSHGPGPWFATKKRQRMLLPCFTANSAIFTTFSYFNDVVVLMKNKQNAPST